MHFKIIPVFLVGILLLTGCDRLDRMNMAKDRFLDRGASEYEIRMDRSDISSLERSLANNIYPMDTQLTSLLRSLSVRDTYPPKQWMERIASEYFWLNGITVMDKERKILAVHPDTGIKQLSYDPAFPEALELRQGRIMLSIEDTPLGKEILLVSSVFENFELKGLIIVNFDPRTFIAQSASPDDIILVSEHEIVWSGRFGAHRSALEQVNWDEMVSRRISGKIRLNDDHFFWFARAVGEDWLIYLVKDK